MGRLRSDAAFRNRVRAASELTVPLSVFLGRTVAAGDPEWTPHDRHVAEAWVVHRESLHTCGVPVDVAFDVDQAYVCDSRDGTKQPRWTARVDTCHPCAALDSAARKHVEEGKQPGVEPNIDGTFSVLDDRLDRPEFALLASTI